MKQLLKVLTLGLEGRSAILRETGIAGFCALQ